MTAAARPRLMIIDDDAAVLPLVERFARSCRFDVSAYLSAREALAALADLRPDAALVDLQMPELSGIDVLRDIGATEPDCQVILMTGNASVDTAIEAVKAGALDYLSKPLDFDRLRALLDGVRESRRRRERLLSAEAAVAAQTEFHGIDRPRRGHAAAVRHHPPAGSPCADGPDRRRNRHGQGAGRAGTARRRGAARQTLPHRQLRGGRRDVVRERAVRTRPRRLHRRHRRQGRDVRAREPRHAVPRRDRRAARRAAAEAAARDRARRNPARRVARVEARRCACHRRHQPRPARAGRRGPLPIGSVLPPQRRRAAPAAAQGTARRHPVPDRRLHPPSCPPGSAGRSPA